MKCVACGGRMKKTRGDYAYASLPGVTLANVDVYKCPECGEEEVSIPHIEDLNRTIARELVRKKVQLAPTEIRFLRKLLGWSGVDFAKHFGVTPETVSRWESGKKAMGPAPRSWTHARSRCWGRSWSTGSKGAGRWPSSGCGR